MSARYLSRACSSSSSGSVAAEPSDMMIRTGVPIPPTSSTITAASSPWFASGCGGSAFRTCAARTASIAAGRATAGARTGGVEGGETGPGGGGGGGGGGAGDTTGGETVADTAALARFFFPPNQREKKLIALPRYRGGLLQPAQDVHQDPEHEGFHVLSAARVTRDDVDRFRNLQGFADPSEHLLGRLLDIVEV